MSIWPSPSGPSSLKSRCAGSGNPPRLHCRDDRRARRSAPVPPEPFSAHRKDRPSKTQSLDRPGGDRHSRRIEAHAEMILSAVAAKSDITLSELRERLKGRVSGPRECQEFRAWGHNRADGGRVWRSRRTRWTIFWLAALGPNIALTPFLSPPPDRARCADPKSLRRRSTRQSALNRAHDTPAKVTDKDLAMHASPLRRPEA